MSGGRRYYVYVVELVSRGARPDLYVGSSAFPPWRRFMEHTRPGSPGSRYVRHRGVRLLPRLYAGLNPLPSRQAAQRAEGHLRRMLEDEGFKVYGSWRY